MAKSADDFCTHKNTLCIDQHTPVSCVDEAQIASEFSKPFRTIRVEHCMCVDAMVSRSFACSSVYFKAFCLRSPVVALLGLHLTQQLANHCSSRSDPLPESLSCTCHSSVGQLLHMVRLGNSQGPLWSTKTSLVGRTSLIQKPEIQKYSKIQSFLGTDVTPEEIPWFETVSYKILLKHKFYL